MNFLKRLDMVPWSKLHHAYGPADDVPDLIRALVEPENASDSINAAAKQAGQSAFDRAEWSLWGNVFHQGSRWQVTAHVVPILVDVLTLGPESDRLRRFLVSYLHHLAMGYPEDTFPTRFDPEEAFQALAGLTDPGGDPDFHDDTVVQIWERDSYIAVESAIEKIAPFIYSNDEATAFEAIVLLASFPRCSASTAPMLQNVARASVDQRAANAAISLAQLLGEEALADAERLIHAPQREVAITAACAALLAQPAAISDQAIALLTQPLDEIAKQSSAHAGTLAQLVGVCLAQVPQTHRDRAIDAIAFQHRGAGALERVSLTASLLNLAFNGRPVPTEAKGLTAIQRRALEAICDYGVFTINGSVFANYALLLSSAGLPDSAASLRRWLDAAESIVD